MTFDRLESFATVDSTMNVAWERVIANGDRAAGTAILAEFQTGGRGRQGRAWFAPPGANVCLTAVGVPVAADAAWQVALLAAIAAAEGVERATGVLPALRFPNDLLLDGRKLGGILVETAPSAASGKRTPLIGIGINVNSVTEDFPPELRDRATSLRRTTGREFAVGAVSGFVLHHLGELWGDWERSGLERAILPRWRELVDDDARRTFRLDGAEQRCRVVDVSGDGVATLETEAGERRAIHAAQVILGAD